MDYFGTLGPRCCDRETLSAMFAEGMDGVRLNLSHTGLSGAAAWLEELAAAGAAQGIAPRLMIDLRGPELRLGQFAPREISAGGTLTLGGEIPLPAAVLSALRPGQEALLDDGKLLLRARENSGDTVCCDVLRGGTLLPGKSIALPGVVIQIPALTESDRENLRLAKRYGVTDVMQPFVRAAADLKELRAALRENGAADIRIYAKIENAAGMAALPDFIGEADEIVIARGDLGNAMPLWELPAAQKRIAAFCREKGKPFMVVTQLLASMAHSAVPTRAEVSDIYNAVLDGASSLMVTGETAAGDYPVEVMRYLVKTAERAAAERTNSSSAE